MAVGTKMNATRNIEELFPINNPSMTKSEKFSVCEVLSQRPTVISSSKDDLGEAKEVEHFINTGNAAPIRIPPRRLPFHKREVVRKEVNKSDVIEHANSPWSAPVVLVKKKDGIERFSIDYRKLNEITRKDVYPLPRCEEILESLASTTYFTHLDLVRGYWQIKVAEEDREKTAFSTPDGHFQNAVWPHQRSRHVSTGYHTAILAGLAWTDCLVYLDDIIVFGRTLDEHNRRLEEVR